MNNQITKAKDTKVCSHCKEIKPLTKFCKHTGRKDGYNNECKLCCKKRHKRYRAEHIEETKLYNKHHRTKNPKEIKLYHNKYVKNKYKTDVAFKISCICRNMVANALNGKPKKAHTMEYFMCSRKEFRDHIEKQFKLWMNWKNHGNGAGKWNVDHIIPCAFFNMLDPVEVYMCCRYQNLQPISWEDNMIKKAKY